MHLWPLDMFNYFTNTVHVHWRFLLDTCSMFIGHMIHRMFFQPLTITYYCLLLLAEKCHNWPMNMHYLKTWNDLHKRFWFRHIQGPLWVFLPNHIVFCFVHLKLWLQLIGLYLKSSLSWSNCFSLVTFSCFSFSSMIYMETKKNYN